MIVTNFQNSITLLSNELNAHYTCSSQLNYYDIKSAKGRTVSDTNTCLVRKTNNRQNETDFKTTQIINILQKPVVYAGASFMKRQKFLLIQMTKPLEDNEKNRQISLYINK